MPELKDRRKWLNVSVNLTLIVSRLSAFVYMLGMFRGSVTMLGKSPKGLSRQQGQQGTGMQAAILREGPREFDA